MTDLRQRIARAIHRYDAEHAFSVNDLPSEHHYGEADAVLAVLADHDRDAARTAARQTTGQDDTKHPAAAIEPQDHPGADLYVRLRKAGEDHDTAQALIYAHARMAVREHTAIHGAVPAVGQPAEAHDTNRAELRERLRLAIARQYLADTGSGRTIGELEDTEFASLADAALSALTVEGERRRTPAPRQPRHTTSPHPTTQGQPMTTGYCPHCGRGDCSPTADQWAEQKQRADKAEAAIARVRALLPPPEHDTDPTLAIHPSRIRAALDGTT